ncbi:MAG TPA: hypothetical protein VMF52_12720 [Steroidobacteraceae bacterium]|nr:hypothetical protein [Steroidobacteraceae bacterium]
MATVHVFRSVLLVAGALSIAACTSQPASKTSMTLAEKKFQLTAKHYDKFEYQGQTIYCRKPATRSMPYSQCISEQQLRLQVENYERNRNAVQPAVIGTPSSIG